MSAQVPAFIGELVHDVKYFCAECCTEGGMPSHRKSLTGFVSHIIERHTIDDELS